ncbi:MAG TPA: ABC transporter permease subunit [Polyangiaceae bacterium]|jgi:ABC-type transport system involved in multi-copper enzyme maturation permease subunit|nr:ABC transporter permease subunit [Polyangiaceae bacterium]
MVTRVAVVAYNTYREAVRARVLHGLLALALATGGYALAVGAFSNRAHLRVVSDLGAASISLYGVIVAVVLGATALYRELELKTIFPILARPIYRAEYLVGKYLGTTLTLAVFIAANTGALLIALADLSGRSGWLCAAIGLGSVLAFGLLFWRLPRLRTLLPIPFAIGLCVAGALLASGAPDDRNVLLGSALLTLCEVAVVAAIATVFAGFSSPFLSSVFTFGVFIVGRSADTLANLPVRMFGETIRALGQGVSRLVPNLMLYVPERPLLTGEAAGASLPVYLGLSLLHTLCWVAFLLTVAAVIFRRRDFQ